MKSAVLISVIKVDASGLAARYGPIGSGPSPSESEHSPQACLAAKQGFTGMPIRMSHARYHNACDFLPTCTAQKGWALSVFALSVTRHGRHADTAWALGLGSSGSASHSECFTRRQWGTSSLCLDVSEIDVDACFCTGAYPVFVVFASPINQRTSRVAS